MRRLLAVWRLFRVVAHVLRGLWTIRTRFGPLAHEPRMRIVQEWSRGFLVLLGVRVQTLGQSSTAAASGGRLLVCNHISWLDVFCVLAVEPARFLSKDDVRQWPVLGALVTGAGTLYIQRTSKRDALRAVGEVAERLRAGETIAVFPEGTTSSGEGLLPFHANLIQAAIDAEMHVQPLGLSYLEPAMGGRSSAVSFVGDETLIASIWLLLCSQGAVARMSMGQPEPSGGRDRRSWAQDLQTQVAALRGATAPEEHP